MNLHQFITKKLGLPAKSIQNTVQLLQEDATVPFIARYRKEQTGNLDETQIQQISEELQYFQNLEKRKHSILEAIENQDALNDQLKSKIENAENLTVLEDLYLPFKKKRKTKADTARENGLEPLAKMIMAQNSPDIHAAASKFVKSKVNSKDEALEGAKHIIAEWINENQFIRKRIRQLYSRKAEIVSKVVKAKATEDASQKFQQYFDWQEPLKRIPSHRFLAIFRADKEGILKLKIEVEKAEALRIITESLIKNRNSQSADLIEAAASDAFSRLLKPSFFTEFLNETKLKADEEAIKVFSLNLEQLLLAPPLGEKRILAIDPGFKSGCKVVCLDKSGKLVHNENIYPHPPQREQSAAAKKIESLVKTYNIEAISIGNGTASRETEQFVKSITFDHEVAVYVVNEAGASVYSASKVARDEFPNYDITVRGAVSIGRRLSDPLAELVKIDPKSIGVGQYQHEVDQNLLKQRLDTTVMSTVNKIGINLNTASKELLSYVSGLGPSLADNIIKARSENGAFASRKELLKVPRLGAKAFEQSAGFLRIKNPKNPLDNSSVHPESYAIVKKMAKDLSVDISALVGNKKKLQEIKLENYITESTGLPTLKDIIAELEKPGVDPREKISAFAFDESIREITDLKPGMKLAGLVNNITNFGCFVDIGLKQSGLVHISKLSNTYVSDVTQIVRLNQEVEVTVLDVDLDRKRIQLSMVD
ncbi:Tex family protein [Zunongwangia endophytica]|uniref:Tex family protein n=1 Tax=Zunongwangia endophytica TaxID=1808945 RepID=A0ABV8HB33_9FLAO|nr:Tex family protein [Zunongwangia endophytica]MDN3593823.1 Tex family protein [Zunongwangia endophytica]